MEKFIDVFIALLNSGILLIVAGFVIQLIKKHSKSKDLQLLSQLAEQAVNYAEQNFVGGENKKRAAVDYLSTELKKIKLFGKFSDEQIDTVIEMLVSDLKLLTAI